MPAGEGQEGKAGGHGGVGGGRASEAVARVWGDGRASCRPQQLRGARRVVRAVTAGCISCMHGCAWHACDCMITAQGCHAEDVAAGRRLRCGREDPKGRRRRPPSAAATDSFYENTSTGHCMAEQLKRLNRLAAMHPHPEDQSNARLETSAVLRPTVSLPCTQE